MLNYLFSATNVTSIRLLSIICIFLTLIQLTGFYARAYIVNFHNPVKDRINKIVFNFSYLWYFPLLVVYLFFVLNANFVIVNNLERKLLSLTIFNFLALLYLLPYSVFAFSEFYNKLKNYFSSKY